MMVGGRRVRRSTDADRLLVGRKAPLHSETGDEVGGVLGDVEAVHDDTEGGEGVKGWERLVGGRDELVGARELGENGDAGDEVCEG